MLTLRPATPADALGVATVHVRSWQEGYRGLIADGYLESLRAEDRAAQYSFGASSTDQPTTIVALSNEVIYGFVAFGACGDRRAGTGEIFALYVEPREWRRGIGTMLITDARTRLHARGFTDAELWVLIGNHAAEHFYRTDGWVPDGISRTVQLWGVEISESRFHRRLR